MQVNMFPQAAFPFKGPNFSDPTPLHSRPIWLCPALGPAKPCTETLPVSPSRSRTMHPTSIANFTATVSIFYAYMEAMMDQRIHTMETIAGATAKVLQQCGRSPHLASLFTLWSTTSNSLWLAERALFPELPAETSLHLALPPDPRPLAACLDSTFEPYANRIYPALEALHVFRHWFSDHYDTVLHKDTYDMLSDALLILQTIDALLALKTQINRTGRAPATTEGPPAESNTAAGSSDPAQEEY